MIKGLARTAVEMQDIDPDAFNLEELKQWQALQERKTLMAEMILDDINVTHIKNVATSALRSGLVFWHILGRTMTVTGPWNSKTMKKLDRTAEDRSMQCWIFSGNGKTFDQLLKLISCRRGGGLWIISLAGTPAQALAY
jgi:hypothetical protein